MYEMKLAKVEGVINRLTGNATRNLCENCHTANGCGRTHGVNLYDTGVCDNCGRTSDVVNCVIANCVVDLGISDLGFWKSRLPRIWRPKRRYGLVM